MAKLHIRKNDQVKVLSGKDRGKVGKVIQVIPDKAKVMVENVNLAYEHVRPNPQKQIKGGINQKAAPLDIAKVQLVCPSCNKPTRVGRGKSSDGKESVRICKKCNANI